MFRQLLHREESRSSDAAASQQTRSRLTHGFQRSLDVLRSSGSMSSGLKRSQQDEEEESTLISTSHRPDFADYADWKLKLLTLEPGPSSAPIVCTLQATTFKEARWKYDAISYLWGDATMRHEITLDGRPCLVTDNLEIALRGLRLKNKPYTLWIDAVCIDQSNDAEKAEQVSQMWVIYTEAKRVVAWLGAEQPWTREAFAFLCTPWCAHNLRDLQLPHEEPMDPVVTPEEGDERYELLIETRNSMKELCELQYFRRVWMVLELAMNKNTYIQCGRLMAPLTWLGQAGYHTEISKHMNTFYISALCAARKWYRRDLLSSSHSVTPLAFLNGLRSHQASDPRDKVYALRIFFGDQLQIAVDYSTEVSTVSLFKKVVRLFLLRGTLTPLHFLNRSRMASLPSWCPDWTTGPSNDKSEYPPWSDQTRAVYKLKGDVLCLRGLIIGVVHDVPLRTDADYGLKFKWIRQFDGRRSEAISLTNRPVMIDGLVCILLGGQRPFCIRRHNNQYQILGPWYEVIYPAFPRNFGLSKSIRRADHSKHRRKSLKSLNFETSTSSDCKLVDIGIRRFGGVKRTMQTNGEDHSS